MISSSASRNAVLKPWGRGRGRGKPFPRGFREDYLPLKHLSPKGWWDLSACARFALPTALLMPRHRALVNVRVTLHRALTKLLHGDSWNN